MAAGEESGDLLDQLKAPTDGVFDAAHGLRSGLGADVVVLTDIFAAGESPISGVTAGRLADAVRRETDRPVHHAGTLDEALAIVSDVARSGDLVVTLGAGSIGGLGDRLLAARQRAVDVDRQLGSEIS